MKRKVSFFVALVATFMLAANVQAAYVVKFADMPHCTWTASYQGSAFTGGDVEIGGTLIVNYTANPSWRFSVNDQKTWSESKTLAAGDFDGEGVCTISAPAMYQPGFKFQTRWVGDGSAAKVMWEDLSGDLKAYRLMISETEDAGNPIYWKNAYSTTKTEQEVSGLAVGHKYYAHLQGGPDADHLSDEVFTREFYAQPNLGKCALVFHMFDRYGDGWDGPAYILLKEDTEETEITLAHGEEGWDTYMSNAGKVTLSWGKGANDSEIRFFIYNGEGEELVYVEDASYELSDGKILEFEDGTQFKDIQLCTYPCAVDITSLDFTSNSDKTEYTVTWDATGADSYQVAVLQKYAPTDAELEKAAKNVTEKSYKISGKANAIQHVYVRAICDEGKKGKWLDAIICDPMSGSGAVKDILPKFAKDVKVPCTDKGDFLASAIGLGSSPSSWMAYSCYHFTLAEKTNLMVTFSSTAPIYNYYMQLFMDPGDGSEFVDLGSSMGGAINLDAGSYYYTVVTDNRADDYTFKITKAAEPTFTTISALNYFDEGNFTNAKEVEVDAGYVFPTKAYRYQPTEDQETFVLFNSNNTNGNIYCVIYEDETQLAIIAAPTRYSTLNMTAGKTYTFYLFPYVGHEAYLEDTYQFTLAAITSDPTQAKKINLDAHETGVITKDDVINEFGYIGKVYEFVIKEAINLGYSFEILGEHANDEAYMNNVKMEIYKGELSGTPVTAYYGTSIRHTRKSLTAESSGTHYYVAIYSMAPTNVEFRVDLRKPTPVADIKAKAIELNKGYESALSVLSPWRYGEGLNTTTSNASFEYYKVTLEKNQRYLITAHILPEKSDLINTTTFGITLLDPTAGTTFSECSVKKVSTANNYWNVLDITPTATREYIVCLGQYAVWKEADRVVAYEFAVSEVGDVLGKWSEAIVVEPDELPYKNEGIFTGNREFVPSSTASFQLNGTSWIQQNGAYDALRISLKVPAGDSLYVEFGGDDDVAIYIYPQTTTPIIVNDVPYAYPYERAAVKNNTSSEKEFAIIGTYNSPRVQAAPYYVRIAKSANDLATATATAKLNQTYVTIPADGGIADAQAALEQLIISAVDGAGTAIGTIVNRGDMWNVNLNEKKASYELNDSDLPLGYKFAKSPTFLQATIRFKDVHIDEVIISSEQDGAVRKVLRNGLIMIDTPYGSFDIMGRRVR